MGIAIGSLFARSVSRRDGYTMNRDAHSWASLASDAVLWCASGFLLWLLHTSENIVVSVGSWFIVVEPAMRAFGEFLIVVTLVVRLYIAIKDAIARHHIRRADGL
jgi:hypothetical protein